MMGVAGRKRSHEARMKEKRSRKAAKAALYWSYAGTGKRRKKQGRLSVVRFNHAVDNCGNVGCKKCYPVVKRYQILRVVTGL